MRINYKNFVTVFYIKIKIGWKNYNKFYIKIKIGWNNYNKL